MFVMIVCVLLLTSLFITLILWLLSRLDSDLQLLFAEKFGRPISDLKGKVIWITGASSGIGESLAYILSSVGAKLVLSGTNSERLENVRKQCIVCGQLDKRDVLVLQFDISDTTQHEKLFNAVISHFSKLDILINNAGRSQRAQFEEIDINVDRQLFDINVFGMINLTRIVLRYFLNDEIKGQFVVTSSGAGKMGVPNSASYTASKHALHGYFECLRTEVQRKGISIVIACPGPVFSRISEAAFTGEVGRVHGVGHAESFRRMATSRCAHLMAIAMANSLDEAWISIQPALTFYYLYQYLPSLAHYIFPKLMTPERAAKIREGNR